MKLVSKTVIYLLVIYLELFVTYLFLFLFFIAHSPAHYLFKLLFALYQTLDQPREFGSYEYIETRHRPHRCHALPHL